MVVRFFRRLAADTAGGMAVLLALTMPIVVGGIGLGTEVGLWYFTQRKLQNAADIAAFAAAAEVRAGRVAEASAAAERAASEAGFLAAEGHIAVTTPYGGDARRVEVRLDESKPRVFSALFGDGAVEIGARAVAQIDAPKGETCILALNPLRKAALRFMGDMDLELEGCGLHTNSLHGGAALAQGNIELDAECLSSSGGVSTAGNVTIRLSVCGAPLANAPVLDDPFASVPPPAASGPCVSHDVSSGVLSPGRYCGGLSINVNHSLRMEPGVYVIEGDFRLNGNLTLTGSEVLIYLKGSGSELTINGTSVVQLSAPTSGPQAGILFFVDRAAGGGQHTLNGNAASSLEGAIYAPAGELTFTGNLKGPTATCVRMVADEIVFTGNSSLHVVCSRAASLDIRSVERVRLVE